MALVMVSGAVASWALSQPRSELTLRLPAGEAVRVPDADVRLKYQGVGHAMLIGGDCVPFISYTVEREGEPSRALDDSLVGEQLGPWRVVAADGEWGLDPPPTPWLARVGYWLRSEELPAAVVAVHLVRLPLERSR